MATLWHPASRVSFIPLQWGEEKEVLPQWITSNLWGRCSLNCWTRQSCCPSSNCFFGFKHPFIDLSLRQAHGCSTCVQNYVLLFSNMPRMLNKDLTWFMHRESILISRLKGYADRMILSMLKRFLQCYFFVPDVWMRWITRTFFFFLFFVLEHNYSWLKLTARCCNFVY